MIVLRILLGLACLVIAFYAGYFAYCCWAITATGLPTTITVFNVRIPHGAAVVGSTLIAITALAAAGIAFFSSKSGDSDD